MQKIIYFCEKYKIQILIFILLLIVLFCFGFSKNKNVDDNIKIEEKEEVQEKKVSNIKVDLKGFVENPGVYEMDENSRIIDVINKAGGLIENANTEYINLSKKLTDEMIIIIYSNDEVNKFKKEDKEIIYIQYECICPDNINDACIADDDVVNTNDSYNSNYNIDDNIISINTDNIDELMKLDGIGQSKAKSIIEYRKEFGNFEKLEDIMNVSGIGETAYSKIKDNIKL